MASLEAWNRERTFRRAAKRGLESRRNRRPTE